MSKFLDMSGLDYLWGRIKSVFVSKVEGKDLSSNDYTTAEKTKLAGIATGANKYTLPTAGKDQLGGVKTTSTVTVTTGLTVAPIIDGVPYYKDTNTTYSAVTASANGLMIKEDKSKLDGFETATNYAKKTDITAMYRHKGSMQTAADLPTAGNTIGDVYNAKDSGMNYVWTGTEWDALGAVFTVDAITNAEIDAVCV